MTILSDYQTTLADLLHDPSNQYWSLTQLARYLNQARTKLVMDTGCLRSLQTVYFTQGVEAYSFGQVTGASIVNGGTNVGAPTVNFSGGGGSGVAATLGVVSGAVTSISFSSFGSGYTSAPTANVIGQPGGVASIAVTNPGVNYTSVPGVGFSGGGGSGAAATATMRLVGGSANAFGAGYTPGDILTATGGTFTRAATFVCNNTNFSNALLLDGGDYSVLPADPVSLSGGTGAGAKLNSIWGVGNIAVTAAGSGYTSTPGVTFSGGGGTAAAATATVAAAGTPVSIAVGAINVKTFDVLGINLFRSNTMRYPLPWKPWSDFSTQMRAWVNTQREPAMWAVYGQNQIYIGPLPDQTYQAELDTIILPTDLAGSTVDPIPDVSQAPIPYYAAHIAKFNDQRFGEAATFLKQYEELTRDAINAYTRRVPDPYSNLRP